MIRLLTSLVLLSITIPILASTNTEDSTEVFFKSFFDIYNTESLLSYRMTLSQKDSANNEVLYSQQGLVEQTKGKYKLSFPEYIVVVQDSYQVRVINERKKILVQHIHLDKDKEFDIFSIHAIKKFLENKKLHIKKNYTNKNTSSYSIIFGNVVEDAYNILIDNKTGYILNVHIRYYDYDDKNNIVLRNMDISYFDYRKKNPKNFNPLKDILEFREGKLKLSPYYKEYTVE